MRAKGQMPVEMVGLWSSICLIFYKDLVRTEERLSVGGAIVWSSATELAHIVAWNPPGAEEHSLLKWRQATGMCSIETPTDSLTNIG